MYNVGKAYVLVVNCCVSAVNKFTQHLKFLCYGQIMCLLPYVVDYKTGFKSLDFYFEKVFYWAFENYLIIDSDVTIEVLGDY